METGIYPGLHHLFMRTQMCHPLTLFIMIKMIINEVQIYVIVSNEYAKIKIIVNINLRIPLQHAIQKSFHLLFNIQPDKVKS